MSDNPSEYLKRTCLICGCHTNQTINIYEPRSGPNIVQLIQAKFKFQPLNEDKYLCFSCNNWLINWHSLQALNSNDAESPSGTFRSHLNSGNVVQDEKSSGSKKQKINVCRPIAHIKPRQLIDHDNATLQQQQAEPTSVEAATQELSELNESNNNNKNANKINFNKRNFRLQLAKLGGARMPQKSMHQCSCGKYMVVRMNNKVCIKNATQTALKCRKCREFSRLKASYMRSIVQVEKELAQREPPATPLNNVQKQQQQNLVIATQEQNTANKSQSKEQQQQQATPQQIRHQHNHHHYHHQQHYLPKPTVDGKVVSMLRRLGTTLSREPQENGRNNNNTTTTNTTTSNSTTLSSNLPQIMSPTKPKSKWLRPLEDDEILVNFNSHISEVLPSLADQFTHVKKTLAARKCLTFQTSTETAEVIEFCNDDDDDENENGSVEKEKAALNEIDIEPGNFTNSSLFNLPKGLTITLV